MGDKTLQADKLFPLSLSQRNIWNLENNFKGTSINNISTTIEIRGRLDIGLLQKSLSMVIAADRSLRTQLCLVDGQPQQYHASYTPAPFTVLDFSQTTESGIQNWEMAVTREPLPLLDLPLYRFIIFRSGEHSGGVLVKTHHIISDGWSQVQLCNRIAQTYLDLLAGKTVELPPVPSYSAHVQAEADYLHSDAYARDKEYWQQTLADCLQPAALKEIKNAAISPIGQRKTFQLSEVLNHAIHSFCLKQRVAPFAVFYMALAIYLKRMGGASRFAIGVPIYNRVDLKDKSTTGMFVSTLPFYNVLDEEWSLNQFNEYLNENWYDLLRHQKFPFGDILHLARERDAQADQLFHIALSYQDSKIFENKETSVRFSGKWHYSGYQSEHICIHLSNMANHRRYAVDYDYLCQLFSEKEIESLHYYLTNILSEALANPDKPIRSLSILGPAEKEKVLYTFNHTTRPLYKRNIYEELTGVAAENPQRAALISSGKRLTYAALLDQAELYARAIEQLCPGGKQLVAVCLPKGFELLAAMVGISRSGNAWLLLSPELPAERIHDILQQSAAALCCTNMKLVEQKGKGLCLPLILTENLPIAAPAKPLLYHQAKPDDLAYVVYTSGSTGLPKGVEIEQLSLLNYATAMGPLFGRGAVLSVCNIGFDAFLLESMVALLNGRTVVLATQTEAENSTLLARLIQNYGVTFLAMTPSRLSAYLREPLFGAALRNMEAILCGGEVFPGELLQQLKTLTPARLYNQYGPSETTVGVSYKLLNDCAEINIGPPMDNCRMYVLDAYLQPLPVGVYGNLYISGVCVGRGYRNAPAQTAPLFSKNPFEPGEKLYKTGDIACWTKDGEIALLGRSDQQIKLRGLRIEPQEIAACLSQHPELEAVAVRAFAQQGRPLLAAYYTAQREVPTVDIQAFAANYLPYYMVPAYLERVAEIPLLPSGKIDYARLPAPRLEAGGAPTTNTRQACILAIFRKVLQAPQMGADSDYFLCGGDSLNAMEAVAMIEKELGVKLRIGDLYLYRNVQKLEAYLAIRLSETAALPMSQQQGSEILPAPEREYYPLTPAQKSIYFQSQLDAQGLAYHMAGAFQLPAQVDCEKLLNAFRRLIATDDVFRTFFCQVEGQIYQKIAPTVSFDLPWLSAQSFEEAAQLFLRPFDLNHAPLLRAALWRDDTDRLLLFIDIHHSISDGVSTPLLMERIGQFYAGQKLDIGPITYKDYAVWQEQQPADAQQASLAYWRQQLSGAPMNLDLPTDQPRPRCFDYRGENYRFALDAALSARVEAFCEEREVSPYMFFSALYGLLLAKITGREDLLVGTPVSGRLQAQLWQVCGLFIQTLPLRLQPQAQLPFMEYLQAVKTTVLDMLDHQDLSIEQLAGALELQRDLSYNPLYQALFALRPMDASKLSLADAPLGYRPLETHSSKLDISLEAAKEGDCYQFCFEYASSLFEQGTIALYARGYLALVEQVLGDAQQPLAALLPLALTDRLALWEKPWHMRHPYLDMPLDMQIRQQAALHAQAPAVYAGGQCLSYQALLARTEQIAAYLQEHGAKPGDVIAFCLPRNLDLLPAMLAIWQCGCAYLPILADFPTARLHYMLENAGARFLLCHEQIAGRLPQDLAIDMLWLPGETPTATFQAPSGRCSTDIAYILYTSGSTGRPKGVMVSHRALANLLSGMAEVLSPNEGAVLCSTNVIFDTFITETLLPLCCGQAVVMADEEEMLLPWELAELLQNQDVGMMQLTPSRLQVCLENEAFCKALAGLKRMIVAGEALSPQLLQRFKQISPAALHNLYGPTEATVYVSGTELAADQVSVIGRPLANCRIYVLDDAQRLMLPTARGELYLAGECLADGYINQAELTARSFLPDPFSPGQRMYKSGDIGRLRADGNIDFLGRVDSQIKLHGQRIELDEISGAMQQSGLVGQAVALARSVGEGQDGHLEIWAYVTPKPGQTTLDIPALYKHLRHNLPSYMLPTQILSLSQLPFLPSGKLDRQALLGMAGETMMLVKGESDKAAPEQNLFAQALAVWQKALQRPTVDPACSFFEQGGSSLGALSVLGQYFNLGYNMTLTQFYENPTLQAQVELLQAGTVPPLQQMPAAVKSDLLLPRFVPQGQKRTGAERQNTLLTGASGFLGAHLLRALLLAGQKQIFCLVRPGGEARLWANLAWYFGEGWLDQHRRQILPFSGDICEARLGLCETDWSYLCEQAGQILHAAADVRHYAEDDSLEATNHQGVLEVISFAQTANIPLYHISTISVSGDSLVDAPERNCTFGEGDFAIGQDWMNNAYVKSKFLAELEIYRAMESGLVAKVFRVGNLVGRQSDGLFQKNPRTNAFYQMACGLRCVGAIPQSMADYRLDLVPVDFCADALVALCGGDQTVYHLIAPQPLPLAELAAEVAPELSLMTDAAFSHLLQNKMLQEENEGLLALLEAYQHMRTVPMRIQTQSLSTQAALAASGFDWPAPNLRTILRAFF